MEAPAWSGSGNSMLVWRFRVRAPGPALLCEVPVDMTAICGKSTATSMGVNAWDCWQRRNRSSSSSGLGLPRSAQFARHGWTGGLNPRSSVILRRVESEYRPQREPRPSFAGDDSEPARWQSPDSRQSKSNPRHHLEIYPDARRLRVKFSRSLTPTLGQLTATGGLRGLQRRCIVPPRRRGGMTAVLGGLTSLQQRSNPAGRWGAPTNTEDRGGILFCAQVSGFPNRSRLCESQWLRGKSLRHEPVKRRAEMFWMVQAGRSRGEAPVRRGRCPPFQAWQNFSPSSPGRSRPTYRTGCPVAAKGGCGVAVVSISGTRHWGHSRWH
jgi:hypothetical protein